VRRAARAGRGGATARRSVGAVTVERDRDSREGVPQVTIVAQDVGGARGMERVLSELVVGLAGAGHPVTVIGRTCELPDPSGVVFRRVRGPARPFLIAYPWFLLAGSLAVRRWRRGVVQVTGGIVLNRVEVVSVHYCHQVARATPSRSTWAYRTHNRLAGALKRLGERVCFRASHARAFVCVSNGVAAEIRAHYPQLADRVLTIHNGVDTDTFAPAANGASEHAESAPADESTPGEIGSVGELGSGHRSGSGDGPATRERLDIAKGRLVAAFVGSEWDRKGLKPTIEALANAPEWDLVVAGGGDEQGYRELADALGVGEAVHWLGVVKDVQTVYRLADAFVLPSSYETFSLVTFEAAASGLPILVTPVNGVRELIEHGQNGFLIEREPRLISAHLRTLASDPALAARLGRAARLSALRFSWEQMVAAHHELYERLAAERG
jgi:UDP-glucose:(heptosyl)LPS alpha-1,3-glucosyltransferase